MYFLIRHVYFLTEEAVSNYNIYIKIYPETMYTTFQLLLRLTPLLVNLLYIVCEQCLFYLIDFGYLLGM